MIQINTPYKTHLLFIGSLIGAAILSIFATLQFLLVVGQIAPQNYIVPLIVGSIFGALIAHFFQKLRLADNHVKAQHRTLNVVLDGIGIGIWDWNPQTNDVYFDERWCQLLGYEQSELTPNLETWKSRVHPDDIEQTYMDINAHITGKTDFYSNVHRMKHKDGRWIYILDRGQIIERDAKGNATRFTGTHSDITHLKKVEEDLAEKNAQLQKLTLIDGLTGLKNRRALDEYLEHQWAFWKRENTPFSILMIDIDFFKAYNDFYGHLEGDNCLQKIATNLKSHCNRPNDIAVRYGGEEFLIAYSGIDKTQAFKMAEQIRASIEAMQLPHEESSINQFVTVSIGVYSCDNSQPCHSILEPIDNADQALYLAKKRGRNQVSSC